MSRSSSPRDIVSRDLKLYDEKLYDLYIKYGPHWYTYEQYLSHSYLLRNADIITGTYHAVQEQLAQRLKEEGSR
jgi:hypothetical protein